MTYLIHCSGLADTERFVGITQDEINFVTVRRNGQREVQEKISFFLLHPPKNKQIKAKPTEDPFLCPIIGR